MIVTTNGDGGDVIYSLCILKHIAQGPHDLLIEENDELTATGRNAMAKSLLSFIEEFVLMQDYIRDCRMLQSTDSPKWRSGGFRKAGLHSRTNTLMSAHLAHYRQITGDMLQLDTSKPWLESDKDKRSNGRIVINRTRRYRNKHFPWAQVVSHYGPSLLFVGLPYEHAEFCAEVGNVEYLPTANLRELAEVIHGSELFIGNQSCAFALAEGLKHPAIQETSTYIPDCIFKRDNVQHVWDGGCTLPAINHAPDKKINGSGLHIGLVSSMKSPPNDWQFPGITPQMQFDQAVSMVSGLRQYRDKSRKEIEDEIKLFNLNRCPDYYRNPTDYQNVKEARMLAGYVD